MDKIIGFDFLFFIEYDILPKKMLHHTSNMSYEHIIDLKGDSSHKK